MRLAGSSASLLHLLLLAGLSALRARGGPWDSSFFPASVRRPRGQLTDIMADDYTMKLLDDLHDAEFGVLIMAYLGHGSNRVAYKQTCIGIQAHKSGRHRNTCCQTMKMLDDLRDNEFSALMRQYNWHGSNTMEQGESSL